MASIFASPTAGSKKLVVGVFLHKAIESNKTVVMERTNFICDLFVKINSRGEFGISYSIVVSGSGKFYKSETCIAWLRFYWRHRVDGVSYSDVLKNVEAFFSKLLISFVSLIWVEAKGNIFGFYARLVQS